MNRMRWKVLAAAMPATMVAAVLGVMLTAPAASAYGRLAQYQIGMSENCNNPSFCGADQLGGFWGWAEFDSDNTADAQLTGCGHTVGGPGPAGAGHFAADVTGWYIGSNGDFILNGTETDTFTGHGLPQSQTFTNDNVDIGIPATPGHYSTDEILGFHAPPGVSFQIQVMKIPGK